MILILITDLYQHSTVMYRIRHIVLYPYQKALTANINSIYVLQLVIIESFLSKIKFVEQSNKADLLTKSVDKNETYYIHKRRESNIDSLKI